MLRMFHVTLVGCHVGHREVRAALDMLAGVSISLHPRSARNYEDSLGSLPTVYGLSNDTFKGQDLVLCTKQVQTSAESFEFQV